MKQLFRTFFLLLVGFSAVAVSAQSLDEALEPPLMQYTPTPQTWSMIRYGNTPVDYYTGAVQVSIPLYEYSDPDFQFSISAGNASGGFLPQRQTGILGLNWFLNCGGTVTREIRGLDDFSITGGVNGFFLGSRDDRDTTYTDSRLWSLSFGAYYRDVQCYTDGRSPQREVEADIFHFNFMGYSGTFHQDMKGNWKVYNTNGGNGTYKITVSDNTENNSRLSKITITTEDGYIYVFGDGSEAALERSCQGEFITFGEYNFSGAPYNYPIVSWFLSSVTAPNGRKIVYTYETTESNPSWLNEHTNNPYYVSSFSIGNNRVLHSRTSASGDIETDEDGRTQHHRRVNVVRTSYLQSISVDNSVNIDLTYSIKNCKDVNKDYIPRDAPGAYNDYKIVQKLKRLDAIQVSYGTRRLRTCNFDYHTASDRLILDSVRVSGVGTYKMTYHEPDSRGYAGVTTPDVDFWGYYNGKNNFYTSRNPMKIENPSENLNESINSTSKNPDFNHSIIGCLRRIEYPTRGFTEFEYEANRADLIVLKRDASDMVDFQDGSEPPVVQQPVKYLARLNSYRSLFTSSDETGGVRIRRIIDNDGLGGGQIREFEYLDRGSSSGFVMYFPRFLMCTMGGIPHENPNLQFPANTFDKSHIGYGVVREIFADRSYVKYEFNNYKTHPDDYNNQTRKSTGYAGGIAGLYAPEFINNYLREPNSRHYQRGKLRTKTLYDAQHNVVRKETTTYNDSDDDFSTYVAVSGDYVYSVKKPTVDYKLTGTEVIEYFGGEDITTTTSYQYNDKGQLSGSSVLTSASERWDITEIKYLHERDHGFDPAAVPMKYLYQITKSYKPTGLSRFNNFISATRVAYKTVGNMVKPAIASRLDTDGPTRITSLPVPNPPQLEFKDKVYYNAYDSKGNPVEIEDAEGTVYSYIWGYGGLYPVAKVMNVRYEALPAWCRNGGNPLTGGLTPVQIDQLYAIGDAYVDVYEYMPIVGLVRHIDPAKKEYYYQYDIHGRLEGVTDQQGVLQQYEYHL
jgi:hypothetical protein